MNLLQKTMLLAAITLIGLSSVHAGGLIEWVKPSSHLVKPIVSFRNPEIYKIGRNFDAISLDSTTSMPLTITGSQGNTGSVTLRYKIKIVSQVGLGSKVKTETTYYNLSYSQAWRIGMSVEKKFSLKLNQEAIDFLKTKVIKEMSVTLQDDPSYARAGTTTRKFVWIRGNRR